MNNWIDITDFSAYKPISTNLNELKKVTPFITEAQEFDLRPLLGDDLYLAVCTDFDSSPSLTTYSDLMNGSTYTYGGHTYQHSGLKAVLVYYSYARLLRMANSNITAFGVVVKTTDNSEPVSEKALNAMINQVLSGGKAYENRVIDFIVRNKTDYPLYKCNEHTKRTGSLRINAIR